ncbi:MAG: hypothetical protein CSA53_08155 [Gammaproteobacteria bacterium]|nr:MAG: hypothetical protein CSA53_08155 [Gammaproteobacteria bacterium]
MKMIYWLLTFSMLAHSSAWAVCNANIQATTPDDRFIVDAANGLVTDKVTGLIWQRCSLGQTGSNCSGAATPYTWEAALQAATDSTFAGYTDWRLPNIKELSSIVEQRCHGPAINTAVFLNTAGGGSWSSSPHASDGSRAWTVFFGNGGDHEGIRSYGSYVRLVRDGQ